MQTLLLLHSHSFSECTDFYYEATSASCWPELLTLSFINILKK